VRMRRHRRREWQQTLLLGHGGMVRSWLEKIDGKEGGCPVQYVTMGGTVMAKMEVSLVHRGGVLVTTLARPDACVAEGDWERRGRRRWRLM